MINSINNIGLEFNDQNVEKDIKRADQPSFKDLLKESVNKTNTAIKEADQLTEAFALGKIDDIHQVTIATEKAGLALNLTVAIQNKAIEAYKEIMRIQI